MTRDYPVETRPEDTTRGMERRRQALPIEQVVREMFMNPIEHRVPGAKNIAVADVERLAAQELRDEHGKPVFRRIWADNCSGMPYSDAPVLLRYHGQSSKPSAVFSGNHGEGAILTNGMANPYGLVFITKTADREMPYMCIWDLEEDEDGNTVGGLVTFETESVDEDGETTVEKSPIADANQLAYFGDYTYLDVWNSAFDNKKFGGAPKSGTVVVELGEGEADSTFTKTQRTYDPTKGAWAHSRWAVGGYMNAKFRSFPNDIELFWGVPGDDFEFNFGEANKRKKFEAYSFKPGHSTVDFTGARKWTYRKITGLDATIGAVTSPEGDGESDSEMDTEDAKMRGTVIISDTGSYPDCELPFTADVLIRKLPDGVEARKLPFTARRYGRVFIDFNNEVFARTEGDPHGLFGVTHAAAKYSVWIGIKPMSLGVVRPGAVWMEAGRQGLRYFDKTGASQEIPWRSIAAAFRESMPPKLVAWIKELDADITDVDLSEPEVQALFDRFKTETTAPRRPAKRAATPDPDAKTKTKIEVESIVHDDKGTETMVTKRSPIMNPGKTHPEGPSTTTRIPARKAGRTLTTETPAVPNPPTGTEKKPPLHSWIFDAADWPEDLTSWAVVWDEPSTANDSRGRVKMNWNHWYVQETWEKLSTQTERPNAAKKVVCAMFMKSALTKVSHRRKEVIKKELDIKPKDREIIFSPQALTDAVMGWWDHHSILDRARTEISAGPDIADEDDVDAA